MLSLWKSIPVFGQSKQLKKLAAYTWQIWDFQHSFTTRANRRLCVVPPRRPPQHRGVQHQGTNQPSAKISPRPMTLVELTLGTAASPTAGPANTTMRRATQHGEQALSWGKIGPLHFLLLHRQWLQPVSKPSGKQRH